MVSLDHPFGIPNLENICLGQHNTRSALNKQSHKQAEGRSHGFRTWLADEQRYLVPPLHWYQRKKVPLSMSNERKEELFCALNTILDAVTALNLRDLEAKAAAAVAADRGKLQRKGHRLPQKEKIRLPILTGRTIHITHFLSLLCLCGLDFLKSLVLP
jgi:hypothetical protein